MRPQWIIDLHEDFPGSALVAAALDDPLIVEPHDAMMGRWPGVHEGRAVVGYGTMPTMRSLRRVPRLGEAVFDDYATLRCSFYYRHVYDLLGRTAVFVPFSAVPQLPLRRMVGGDRVFVRSDTNYKLFPAGVHAIAELGRWLQTYDQYRDELVVVSEVVSFEREFRCFCRNGRFVCGSSYPIEPYLPVPDDVRGFAEAAAARLLPHGSTMVTVDVGVGRDGMLRLVEMGGVNSWGIYGSHVADFIAAMEAEALARADA
ncbi:ATP-grasp domain-containing protein [Nocardia otitidiscaviarum]|uniref:ATP-grasp domain-containing protein n=1 Tax=Nocardia otitidiscaviarum TaxID=1823 RepID=UPI0018955114|nr:ATP-grasp domain-containing protein [Nocardia otitidiscaviarum]MBF6178101.1 ATP-grasp domain-containing protein [Nocardia otitidiscaviarum]